MNLIAKIGLMAILGLATVGAVKASADEASCCKPGAACCKPGAECCPKAK